MTQLQSRTNDGKFARKSETVRKVRTIRLTDETWGKINQAAKEQGVTKADLIEQMVEDGAFNNPSQYFF